MDLLVAGVRACKWTSLDAKLLNLRSSKRICDLTEALAQRDAAERRFFFDIADLSTDWFFELDAGLRHTYLSENFSKLTGIANIQFLGRHLGQLRDLSGVLRGRQCAVARVDGGS